MIHVVGLWGCGVLWGWLLLVVVVFYVDANIVKNHVHHTQTHTIWHQDGNGEAQLQQDVCPLLERLSFAYAHVLLLFIDPTTTPSATTTTTTTPPPYAALVQAHQHMLYRIGCSLGLTVQVLTPTTLTAAQQLMQACVLTSAQIAAARCNTAAMSGVFETGGVGTTGVVSKMSDANTHCSRVGLNNPSLNSPLAHVGLVEHPGGLVVRLEQLECINPHSAAVVAACVQQMMELHGDSGNTEQVGSIHQCMQVCQG